MVSLRILELIKEETGPGDVVIHSQIHWSVLGQSFMRGEVSSRKRLSSDSGKRNHLEGVVGKKVDLSRKGKIREGGTCVSMSLSSKLESFHVIVLEGICSLGFSITKVFVLSMVMRC